MDAPLSPDELEDMNKGKSQDQRASIRTLFKILVRALSIVIHIHDIKAVEGKS